MTDKVIDFNRAREEKKHDLKELKLKKMRQRFDHVVPAGSKNKVTKATTQEKMRLGPSPKDELKDSKSEQDEDLKS